MTLDVNDAEKRADLWIADGLDRQPLEARTGRGEPVEAARALTLDVGNDTGTPR